jgi:tetratricopeptide (TPR) repeat protein
MSIVLLLALAAAPQQAETKVRDAIGALEKALTAKDDSVGDQFDFPRLLKEMERRGSIPDGTGDGFGRGVRRLEENFSSIISAPGALNGGWDRVEPLSVRINPAGDEAQAFCRVTIGGKKSKYRFWLSRAGDAWKPFDYEALDGSYRLSVIGLQYAPGVFDDEDKNALRDGVMTLQRASVHLTKGQAAGAREALAMARRSSPPAYVLDWIDLVDGLALNALGNPSGGLKAADRVLDRQKDLAVAHRLKALCLASLGESAKAILAAKDYLQLVGDDADLWVLVGGACEKLDQGNQAIEAYRKAADADPEDRFSRWHLGRVSLEQRRTTEAAAWFTAAARLAPPGERIFENAADLLDRSGAHGEALELSNQEALRRPEDPAVLFRRGRALRALGRIKDAEEVLRRAPTGSPDTADVSRELVLVLAQSGKDGEAQERMRLVAAGDGWAPASLRAFVHAAAGRSARALEELKTALRAEESLTTSFSWIEKEAVFDGLRKDKEGGALWEGARATRDYWLARQDPKLAPDQRLRIAAERIRAVPDHALAYGDQGRLLRRLRRLDESLDSIHQAIQKSGDKTLFQDELGKTLAAQGRLDEALAVAEGLIRARPNAEELGMDLRVSVFEIAGKRDAAVRALQLLLEKHPDRHASVAAGEELEEFRRLAAVQELLRIARARAGK